MDNPRLSHRTRFAPVAEHVDLSPELTASLPLLAADPTVSGDLWALCATRPILEHAAQQGLFLPPQAVSTQRARAGKAMSLELFAERLGVDGGLVDQPAEQIAKIVERWLAWLGRPITREDPGWSNHPRTGYRRSRDGLKRLEPHFNAASQMLLEKGRHDVDLTTAAKFVDAHDRSSEPRKAYPITLTHLRKIDRAFTDGVVRDLMGELHPRTRPEILDAWCVRERAALLFSWWGGLRVGERGKLRDATTVVTPTHLSCHLGRTKKHPEGHIITIRPRGELCPVSALLEFLELCEVLGGDRDGQLLPPVDLGRYHLTFRYGPNAEGGLAVIAEAAGISEEIDLAAATHYLGNHGYRRGVATELANRNVDLEKIRRFLRHTDVTTASGYTDVIAASAINHRELGL